MGVRVEGKGGAPSRRGERSSIWTRTPSERSRCLGERVGPRVDDPLPWSELDGIDAVYFTAGDAGAVRAARAAHKLVATVRAMPALAEAGIES